jgi:hydrogenase expression/formation protein HypE
MCFRLPISVIEGENTMDDTIKLCHGNGGTQTMELITDIFYKHFRNPILSQGLDAAVLKVGQSKIAFTTDTFVVKPIFFSGGDIGKLSICGTINDLVVVGAKPLYISCGMIIEEGFDIKLLERIVSSMEETARLEGVKIVTGDTKVVEKGAVDQLFINTSGIGQIYDNYQVQEIHPSDQIIVTGTIAEHGTTIGIEQYKLKVKGDFRSDCASLYGILKHLEDYMDHIKFMRDPTRGGIATTLNELAVHSGYAIGLIEKNIPIRKEVAAINELLGLDPLYMACEGRMILIVDKEKSTEILHCIQKLSDCRDAQIIGEFLSDREPYVFVENSFGGKKMVKPLEGEMIPRIC